MATIAPVKRSAEERERLFYLIMAIAMAATVVVGFSLYIVVGLSSFASPWWVHVHAVTYMGWIALYLTQNILVVRGALAQHRRLGALMGLWAVWMVVVGSALLGLSIAAHRAPPPVFTASFLIVMDELTVLLFAALVGAGLWLRARKDWHRRLMFAATVTIIAPAIGRITELTTGFSWTNIILGQLAFIAVATVFDITSRGHIHPALLWGAAAITAMGVVTPPLANLPAVVEFADGIGS